MMKTDITLTVYPQDDYQYEVLVGEVLSISYREPGRNDDCMSFGSIEEMRAVAKAMLNACDMKEQMW
jgi:hypothetical protein